MKAVGLFSGGLDSTLAIKVILDQGIEVVALNFKSPFCCCHKGGCSLNAKGMSKKLGVEFKSIYLGQDYLKIVKQPKYGYGKNLNPCIDCRILKFKGAKKFMQDIGASFIFTGEVLGQRPMSQHKRALKLIEKESKLEGLVLRPLSAKLLPPTIVEENGWVNRESLLDICGRGRRPQMKLASSFGIDDYPCPAGGCLLTDPNFCRRFKDLLEYEDCNSEGVELLKLGRHFRITSKFKLIVGRNEKENNNLFKLARAKDLFFETKELPGPAAIGRGIVDNGAKEISAEIIARYTSLNEKIKIRVRSIGGSIEDDVYAESISENSLKKFMI